MAIRPEVYIPNALLVQWHITDRCTLNCQHCYKDSPGVDLPFDTLAEILAQIRALASSVRKMAGGKRLPVHITVTGGEPFLRDDFFRLMEQFHALRSEFSFAILSNGSQIDWPVARELGRLKPGFVQLSLEGKRATHDEIRGNGDFERVVEAARSLVRARVPVLISFTAHRGNFREFREVAALGRWLGVRRVWADRFIPLGDAQAKRDWVLSPAETHEFFEIMRQARAGGGPFNRTEIAMHRALQFLAGDGKPYRCQAGGELITVLANGTLCPCRRMPIPVGNLLESPLVGLYQSALFCALRDKTGVCHGCEGCFYERVCNGGLRCLSLAMTGQFRQADPGCWLSKVSV